MTRSPPAPPRDREDDQLTPPGVLLGARVALLTLLGLGALAVPMLALPAGFILWIGWLSLPRMTQPFRRAASLALATAALAAAVGLVRFVLEHAVAGIVSGGQTATSRRAISRLRELVFAQDMMRKNAIIDPDGDGIGSAGLIGELAGSVALRTGPVREFAILNREWRQLVETPLGPAAKAGGFLFLVCLPTREGWTARPGREVDDERAERRFAAYAWPALAGPGFSEVYFVDEHERILIGRAPDGVSLPHVGSNHPPACDAASSESESLTWTAWENKPPRAHLPGEPR